MSETPAGKDRLFIVRGVKECVRCGENHPALIATRFVKPPIAEGETYNAWAMCPNTRDPLFFITRDA